MAKQQKHVLTPEEIKWRMRFQRLNQPFSITSVCRGDLIDALDMTEDEALAIDDGDMEQIASKLADAYCDNGFWIDLPIVAAHVLEREEP